MKTQMKTFFSNICRILSATCLSVLCLIALSTQAATSTVITTNDSGAGSLRQALADVVDGDTINFDSALNGQTITLTSGELLVNKSISINGPGADNLTVDGNHASRVFHVSGGVTVTLSDLTIANGASDIGGGIFNDHAYLTLSNCTVSGNSATGSGGGLDNGDLGTTTLGNTIAAVNTASTSGPDALGTFASNGNSAAPRHAL